MNKKFTVVISNPTEPIGLGSKAFGGVVCAAYDVDLGEIKPSPDVAELVRALQLVADSLPSQKVHEYCRKVAIAALAKHGGAK